MWKGKFRSNFIILASGAVIKYGNIKIITKMRKRLKNKTDYKVDVLKTEKGTSAGIFSTIKIILNKGIRIYVDNPAATKAAT